MADDYRIAIAGIGAVAEMHALSIGDIGEATLVAGSCRAESRGRAFADEYGCEWFADTEAMLDESGPDVLIVCTPSGARLKPTLAAAERRINVLCEKPLEITTERIDRMAAACKEAGVALGGVFQQRFTDIFREVHGAAEAGRFGDLSVRRLRPLVARGRLLRGRLGAQNLDGGGAMMNQSIHAINAVQWLAGTAIGVDSNPIAEVFAYTDRLAHAEELMEVEGTAVAVVR